MTMKNTLMVVLVAGALVALVLSTPSGTQGEGEALALTDVQVTPDPPYMGSKAEISCRITDETDVKYVFLFYCSDLACLPPIEMTKGTDGRWTALTYTLDSTGNHHFNITVEYQNGTRAWNEDRPFKPVAAPTSTLEVVSFAREPRTVKEGNQVDVYCLPEDAANISQMWVKVKVDGVPGALIDMTKLGNGTYHGKIGPYVKGQQVAYNVTAKLSSGTMLWTDDVTFTPEEKSSDGDDGGFIPAVGAAAVIAAMMGLTVSFRGRRRRSA